MNSQQEQAYLRVCGLTQLECGVSGPTSARPWDHRARMWSLYRSFSSRTATIQPRREKFSIRVDRAEVNGRTRAEGTCHGAGPKCHFSATNFTMAPPRAQPRKGTRMGQAVFRAMRVWRVSRTKALSPVNTRNPPGLRPNVQQTASQMAWWLSMS